MRVAASPNAYVSAEILADYSRLFLQYLTETGLKDRYRNFLVLLDGHSSHLFNHAFLQLMSDNNIQVAAFPPHTTHIIQPLDDVPFAGLKKKWQKTLLDLNRDTVARPLTKGEFLRTLEQIWAQTMTPQSVKAGFENCGIWPADSTVAKVHRTATAEIIFDPPDARPGASKLNCWLMIVPL
jgi:hypothetical protein